MKRNVKQYRRDEQEQNIKTIVQSVQPLHQQSDAGSMPSNDQCERIVQDFSQVHAQQEDVC